MSEHPYGLVSDAWLGRALGIADVTVGITRRELGIPMFPSYLSRGFERKPWAWRMWLDAWGESRVRQWLDAHFPSRVQVLDRLLPDVWLGKSLEDRAKDAEVRKQSDKRRKDGVYVRGTFKPKRMRRNSQAPRTPEAARRLKLGLTLTKEEQQAARLRNLQKAQEANKARFAALKAERTAREKAAAKRKAEQQRLKREAYERAKQQAAQGKRPKPAPPSGTKHKPDPAHRVPYVDKSKWSGHEPFTEHKVALSQHKSEADAIAEFIRLRGVTVLAPAGSGAKVGTVLGVEARP